MEQILCNNLEIGYDKKVLIEPINLIISTGDYWCITGANGMGKSTFIKTLLNLTPLIGGNIELLNGLHQVDIGYLPQQKPHQKNFPASVWEIVISGSVEFLPTARTLPEFTEGLCIRSKQLLQCVNSIELRQHNSDTTGLFYEHRHGVSVKPASH